MPNLSTLSRGTQLLVGAGVLLLIDMFLDWQSVDVGPFSAGQNAWSGFWGVIFVFALLKNLIDDYSTIWSYIGVLLAAGVAYGAWLRHEESGGSVESLKA